MALGKDSSPVYRAFHHWLDKNRGKIKADANTTVIYSGMDSGGMPEWKKLADHARDIRRLTKVDPEWQPIEQVLSKLAFDISDYKSDAPLPSSALRFGSVWDFACKAASKSYITRHESQQVWKNLSAWYVKNSSGHVWIWKGDVLKAYPVAPPLAESSCNNPPDSAPAGTVPKTL